MHMGLVEGMKNMGLLGFYQVYGWANHVTFSGGAVSIALKVRVITWNGPCATQPHWVAVRRRDNKKDHLCAACGSVVPVSATDRTWVTVSHLRDSCRGTTELVSHLISQYLWSSCISSKEAVGPPSPFPWQGLTVGCFTLTLGLLLTC